MEQRTSIGWTTSNESDAGDGVSTFSPVPSADDKQVPVIPSEQPLPPPPPPFGLTV